MTLTTAPGPLGVATGPAPADAAALEDAGARTLWLAGGAIDRLDRLTALLDGTRDAVVVPGIVPTGRYPASAVAAVHADAARRHPGRYLTGLGAPQQPRALDALHRHLDELDALGLPSSERLLAALGPRKLDVAGTRCAGAVTLLVTPEHTARARAALGPDRLLAVMLPTVLGTDRTALRELAGFLLGVPGYRAAVRGLGFTDAEVDARADRLLDAVSARGGVEDIAARVAEHRAAGADHVVLSPVGDPAAGAALLRALRWAPCRAAGAPRRNSGVMPKEPTRLPKPELDLDPDHPHVADWFHYADLLTDAERADLRRVREFLRAEVAPVVLDAWDRAVFPMQLVKGFAGLDLAGAGYADPPASRLFLGFLHAEISRVDPSVNSFYGVHTGLAMGSIHAGGTPEQRERWLPAMSRMDSIGAFGLTEPHGGSDVAGGMETTATRDGDEWVLDGEKRWIGNATFADLIIVWARDTDPDAGGAVRGFVVPSPSEGMTITKIEGKQSLRIVQNADILLDRVRVPESHRLSGGSGTFRDAGLVLQRTRANAAWGAVGVQMAAYELALSYAAQREQFGRPIGGFQLMQDLLVRMLGNVSASLGMAVRNAQLLDEGRGSDAHSSLVKEFCATRMRETVALGRQLVGGNGVVLENRIAKYFADAEAMFSFEGTREMNTLIVGKAITGQSAFVR